MFPRSLSCKIMKVKRLSVGKGKYLVNLVATITMNRLIVSIVSGERPHMGAALGIPQPNPKNSSPR